MDIDPPVLGQHLLHLPVLLPHLPPQDPPELGLAQFTGFLRVEHLEALQKSLGRGLLELVLIAHQGEILIEGDTELCFVSRDGVCNLLGIVFSGF